MQPFNLILSQLRRSNGAIRINPTLSRYFTTEKSSDENVPEVPVEKVKERSKLSKFAQAFERYTVLEQKVPEVQTFPSLVRHSKFVDLGDPEGKLVLGKIFHVVNDDLYIDFGWKFHCVCVRPVKNAQLYVRGATVRLKIKELELSTKFLGASKDLTLLEADCILLALVDSPARAVAAKYSDV